MPERHLTISTLREPWPLHYTSKPDRVVSFLQLRWRWLSELGFECGEKIRVVAERGRVVIEPFGGEEA